MLSFSGSLKILLSSEPCDMRKSFDTLGALVTQYMKEDLCSGTLFVFSNRLHTRIKILFWDGTGLWCCAKRLERGRFSWPKHSDAAQGKVMLRPEAFAMLTDGIDLKGAKMKPWYQRE